MRNVTVVCLLLASLFASAQGSELIHKVKDDVYVIQGGGGKGANVGVLLDGDSTIVVDTMVSDSRDYLVRQLGLITDKPVKMVLNTHDHFDHTGSNAYFSERGALVLGSESADYENPAHTITFKKALQYKGRQLEINAYAIRSHSDSDILYYLPDSDIMFLGDIYTDEWYPSFFAGGLQGQLDSISLALSLGTENTIYIPGHGSIANKQQLQSYAERCANWVERIMTLHAQGVSEKDMIDDSTINSIRNGFIHDEVDKSNFDRWFEQLVQNTINIQLEVSQLD